MDGAGSGKDQRIEEIRRSIDEIDEKILDLLNERMGLAKDIGALKAESGTMVLDKTREEKILRRLESLNRGPAKAPAIRRVFSEIIAACRKIQEPRNVAYLGPEATFTHVAAIRFFTPNDQLVPTSSIRDVFESVEKERCDYGVVPVENSIEGAVNHTLDLFLESGLKVCAEIYMAISHDLLSKSGDISKIRKIYSHPQPFAQCRTWLKSNLPDARLVECSSTAQAAQKALLEDDAAAIAGSEAARIYELKVVEHSVQDFAKNTTRFLVVGHDKVPPTGDDKTSIMFVTAHVPGALFRVLEPIAREGINMLKLESRPTKHENWSYVFFVDLEGHADDAAVKRCLSEMKGHCQFLKVLGSYPMARMIY